MAKRGYVLDDFWSRLSEAERAELRRAGTSVRYVADDPILRQGDRSRHLIVILTGSAKVVISSRSGPEKLLTLRGPGSLIGELAALTDGPRTATVRALEQIHALTIGPAEFDAAARRHPGLRGELVRVVAERLAQADVRLTESSLPDTRPRLAALLASLGEQLAATSPVTLRLSRPELASLAATSESSVARAIRELRVMNLIRTGRRRIVLVDVPALRRYAETDHT